MEYFQVRYNSRVIIYEHKMFIRLATEQSVIPKHVMIDNYNSGITDWRPTLGTQSKLTYTREYLGFGFKLS